MHKANKNDGAKTMENIVLHFKLVRGVGVGSLAYVIRENIKVTYISPGYHSYLKLNKEIIARAPIVSKKFNFIMS